MAKYLLPVTATYPGTVTNNALESSVASIDTAVGLRRSRAIGTLALDWPGMLYPCMSEELEQPEYLDIPVDR